MSAAPFEEHPADGDGPTIQAGPMMEEIYAQRAQLSEPPTLMEIAPEDRPRPRRGGAAGNSGPVEVIEPEEFEGDQDETIVGNARCV